MKEDNDKKEEKQSGKNNVITIESIGAVGAVFSLLALFILLTGSSVFGGMGNAIKTFLLGVFGYGSYIILPALFAQSGAKFFGKKLFRRKWSYLCTLLTVFSAMLFIHAIATSSWNLSGYLVKCFKSAENGAKSATFAGWLGGLVVYTLRRVAGKIGSVIILAVCTLALAALVVRLIVGKAFFIKIMSGRKKKREENPTTGGKSENAPLDVSNPNQAPIYGGREPQNSFNAYGQNDTDYRQSYGKNPNVAPSGTYPPNYNSNENYSAQYPVNGQYNSAWNNAQNYRENTGYYNGVNKGAGEQSGYGVMPEMRQRPGVRLNENGGNAYSPFSIPSPNAQTEIQADKGKERAESLYIPPAESYRKNLIFDNNAQVNKRPFAPAASRLKNVAPTYSPIQSQKENNATEDFNASYTSAYADAVNNGGTRPEKIFENRDYTTKENIMPSSVNGTQPSASMNLNPHTPTDFEHRKSYESNFSSRENGKENISKNSFSRESDSPSTFIKEERQNRMDPIRREETKSDSAYTLREDYEETPQQPQTSNPSQREENGRMSEGFKNLFSTQNPNIFGGGETAMRGDFSDKNLDTEEEARGDRNSSIHIFDEPSDEIPRRSESRSDMPLDRGEETGLVNTKNDRLSSDSDFMAPRTNSREDGIEINREINSSRERVPEKPILPRSIRPYTSVPLTFFDCTDVIPDSNAIEVEENKRTILDTLNDYKVTDATIASVTYGPTVTRYNVAIPRSISPKKVVSLDQEIAISLHAAKGVNIYPNFEDGAVSIEVPNRNRQFVSLGCMLMDDRFMNAKPTSLTFAMGKDVGNKKVFGDIRKMTHILVAGTSGSGKSVFLHSLIISLIYRYSPADLRLIIIDPKRTEFVVYENLPHLIINDIISDIDKVIRSLDWSIGEMNRRYALFENKSRSGTYVVSIDEYNANLAPGEEKLPKIVIIVDELADLMLADKKNVEDRIQNLTQKSRAAGIHMILTTQRPSADVITGTIKSNLKTRIALSVASDVDSRVILDMSGANKLLGKGDMLYTTEGDNTPVRLQSPSIQPETTQKIVGYIKEHNDCIYDDSIAAYINKKMPVGDVNDVNGADESADEIYIEALRCVIESGSASISMIQRKCSVGYNKAGKIVEWMEDQGYISKFDGAKARKVLIAKDEFEEKYGRF